MLGQPGHWPTQVTRNAFESIQRRTFPAGTRVAVTDIGVDLRAVDARWAGMTGAVIGDHPEIVWTSYGLPHLGPGEVLHRVLFDGATEPITISDRWLVRTSQRSPLAPKRTYVRPRPLEYRTPEAERWQADPAPRDAYNEIQARRWPPGRRFAVLGMDASGTPSVREGVVLPGPVSVTWSARRGGYEFPADVLHRVRFDDATEPDWVSDHRMAGVQDNRAAHTRNAAAD